MFSKVTLDSGINKDSFLVCGYPTGEKDLTGYTAYEKFLEQLDYGDEICVHADVYTYGEGEYVDADINELAYLNTSYTVKLLSASISPVVLELPVRVIICATSLCTSVASVMQISSVTVGITREKRIRLNRYSINPHGTESDYCCNKNRDDSFESLHDNSSYLYCLHFTLMSGV